MILTGILAYFVMGFVVASLITMFLVQISKYIFKEDVKNRKPLPPSEFGFFIIGWPIFFGIILLAGTWGLFESSFKGYITWLSSILGDKK